MPLLLDIIPELSHFGTVHNLRIYVDLLMCT